MSPKKALDSRDRRRLLEQLLLICASLLATHSTEVEKLLSSYGVSDYIATIVVFMIGDGIRRYYAASLLETSTTTTTAIVEVTEPVVELATVEVTEDPTEADNPILSTDKIQ